MGQDVVTLDTFKNQGKLTLFFMHELQFRRNRIRMQTTKVFRALDSIRDFFYSLRVVLIIS